jgi:hypothetical protein
MLKPKQMSISKAQETIKKPDKRYRKFISFSFEINKYSKSLGTTQSESAPPV